MVTCAIIGATGLVGSTFLKILEEKKLKIDKYELYASKKSQGKKVKFMNENYEVLELTKDIPLKKFTYALFSAGSSISKEYAPLFASEGTIVIDNSSYFRMDKNVPLIVPEVNFEDIDLEKDKIIANPNCSTIQAILPLKILDDMYKIKRIVYSTYQAVSGAGIKGITDLALTSIGQNNSHFPHKIYNNCIPHIDDFADLNYTKEELKMINETRKILNNNNLKITATCVRVPVINSHSESINIEFENESNVDDIKQILNISNGIVVLDEPSLNIYPLSSYATSKNEVFVGRIRKDSSVFSGINMWVVSDNIRKGAALNAIQILEKIIQKRKDSV